MLKLSDIQKNFILENFFDSSDYAGWRNIANALLDTGSCIVVGNECIWIGGIGNFIKTTESENAFGCLKYEFDLDSFLRSKWYEVISTDYFDDLIKKIDVMKKEVNEISKLNNNRFGYV